ncbi:hypothetical protein PG997_006671 [Apiospora hydei]|uniref:Uncharacterized protein n=1 Tax=Apiospora hydei TaxID=1337664 RepID=A0ABR1WRQ9_9PEZI
MANYAHHYSKAGSLHSLQIPLETMNESVLFKESPAARLLRASDHDRRLFPPDVTQATGVCHYKKPQIWDRLSYSGAAVLVLGTAILLAICGFLLFFWTEALHSPDTQATRSLWKQIVDAEWTTRVVTISIAVIRTVVSLQAGFAMAMIAALFLESAGTRPYRLPELSVYRATFPNPTSLLRLLRFTNMASCAYSILVVLTALLVTISQFTSTILLSDFSSTNITKSFESITVNYNMAEQQETINFVGSAPSAFWRFAEKTEPPTEGDGLVDTGPSLRGMIPWADASHRRKLRFYEGPAVVLDARVSCIRPGLSDTSLGDPDDPNGRVGRFLRGNITFGTEYAALRAGNASNREDFYGTTSFGCMLGVGSQHAFGSKASSSICQVYGPQYLPGTPLFGQSRGTPYLVIKSEGIDTDAFVWEELVVSDRGAWKSFSTPGRSSVLVPQRLLRPPGFGRWFDTLLLGYNDDIPSRMVSAAHDTLIALFEQITDETDNPAYAMQTLFTILFQMQYYDRSYAFGAAGLANYDMGESVPIPVRWIGLYWTFAILALHIFGVFTTLALFLARTEVSLLGNYWQAVAQVVSADTAALLRQADGMRDKEV